MVEARARAEARGEELMFVVLDVSATSRADADTIQAFQVRVQFYSLPCSLPPPGRARGSACFPQEPLGSASWGEPAG